MLAEVKCIYMYRILLILLIIYVLVTTFLGIAEDLLHGTLIISLDQISQHAAKVSYLYITVLAIYL
jgi:hypothetical protein